MKPLLLFLTAFLLISCGSERAKIKKDKTYEEIYREELSELLHDRDLHGCYLDSAHIRLFTKNTREIDFTFHVKRNLSNDLDHFNTGRQYLYFPILISPEEFDILQYPASDSLSPGLIRTVSNSGINYLLASTSIEKLAAHGRTDSAGYYKIAFHIRCILKFVQTADEYLLPLFYDGRQVDLDVSTATDRELVRAQYRVNGQHLEMTELPTEISPSVKSYRAKIENKKGTVASIGTGDRYFFPYRLPLLIITCIFILALLYIFLEDILWAFYTPYRYDFFSDFRYLKKKIQDRRYYFDYPAAYHPDDGNNFKSRRQKKFIRMLVVLIVLFLVLLISVNGQSGLKPLGAGPRNYIIENLQLELTPNMKSKNELQLNAKLHFQLTTKMENTDTATVFMVVDSVKSEIEAHQIEGSPPGVKAIPYRMTDGQKGYFVSISSGYTKPIRDDVFELLQTNALDNMKLQAEEPFIDKYDKENTVEIIFNKFEYDDQSYISWLQHINKRWRIHKYPYDEATLKIPVMFDHYTIVRNITIGKVEGYVNDVPVPNNRELAFKDDESFEKFLSSNEQRVNVSQNTKTVIKVSLHRSWFYKFFIPLLLFVASIGAPFLVFASERNLFKVLASVVDIGYIGFLTYCFGLFGDKINAVLADPRYLQLNVMQLYVIAAGMVFLVFFVIAWKRR